MHAARWNGRIAFALATAAVLCAAAFTAWALTASVYSSGQTILEANPEVLVRVALAVPLTVALGVWILLHVACRFDARWAKTAASVAAGLVTAFALVTGFSIGLFVLPLAALLALAVAFTPVARPA